MKWVAIRPPPLQATLPLRAVDAGALFMSGTISFNDGMPASGLDPGTAPDWRSLAPSSARLSFATPQFSCTRNERDWFLYLTYSAGQRPGTVLRRFAEAYLSRSRKRSCFNPRGALEGQERVEGGRGRGAGMSQKGAGCVETLVGLES
jgi:hypothetical protein